MMAVVMSNLEKKGQKKAPVAAPSKPAAAPAKPAEAPKVAAAAPASTGLKSENIFGMMATYLN